MNSFIFKIKDWKVIAYYLIANFSATFDESAIFFLSSMNSFRNSLSYLKTVLKLP